MTYYSKVANILGIVVKIIAIVASVYGLFMSMEDRMSLTFFTNLSNIWIDCILFVFLILDIVLLVSKGKKNYKKNVLYIIKFVCTCCITLTFFVYMLLLAPTVVGGIWAAYSTNHYASLCVHFIGPVLSILDFLVFDYDYESNIFHVFFATVPPLAYTAFVVILGQNGVRWYGDMLAPYNFLNYGAATGWFGYNTSLISSETLGIGVTYMIILLTLIFILVGGIYLILKNVRRKHIYKKV